MKGIERMKKYGTDMLISQNDGSLTMIDRGAADDFIIDGGKMCIRQGNMLLDVTPKMGQQDGRD